MASIVLPPPLDDANSTSSTGVSVPTEPSAVPSPPTREELVKRLRAKCVGKGRVRGPAKDALASQLSQSLSTSEGAASDGCPQLIQTLLAKMGTKKVRRNPLAFAKKVISSLVQPAPVESADGAEKPAITMVAPPGAPSAVPKPRRRGRNRRRGACLTTPDEWLLAHPTTPAC